ncbi:MAG: putative peptidoglycan glycosyltransferase FtsW [Lachnospiraceae bacterium]|nr:putative peptidoglycan glycosyltransferase FtsW [Lachnospiraceae bacterium]MDD6505181.1 putative peptidoglycan glycosyltransferase FtsW [Lachnospiraceae bacterium]
MREKTPKAKKTHATKYFDYNLLFILIFIICFGLVMLYSSSSYTASSKFGDSAYYLKRQVRAILIGVVPMIALTLIDYRFWKKWGVFAYLVSFGLCVAVMIPGVGTSSHGSARWLAIGPISFQPSELCKITMILVYAILLELTSKKLNQKWSEIKLLAVCLPVVGVVAASNLSTAIIIAGIVVGMLFVASPKYKDFLVIGLIGIAGILLFIFTVGYRGDRVSAWLHPETAGDKGYQTLMGLYAIGSGGIFGKGLGGSLQKMGHVPESQNDMIFTIICEELGLFGGICVILLYILMIWRMMVIANNARDMFGSMLVVGVMVHISLQVILNIAVVTNSIPNTGVTLPFISYGGTSIMFLMMEMGLVLSVSRGIKLEDVDG